MGASGIKGTKPQRDFLGGGEEGWYRLRRKPLPVRSLILKRNAGFDKKHYHRNHVHEEANYGVRKDHRPLL